MEHFYNKVEGWFEPSDKLIYDRAVNRYNDGDIFVEIGSYKGRSSSAMAVNIINSKKKIKFYCVDTWEGSEEHKNNKEVIDKTLYSLFVKNTKPVYPLINPIKKLSKQAANDFEDKKLWQMVALIDYDKATGKQNNLSDQKIVFKNLQIVCQNSKGSAKYLLDYLFEIFASLPPIELVFNQNTYHLID
jgi:hypothetical protein